MATPSLAMIPSAYADSKVYSVLPNNGDGDFTFNRDSSATRVGQNGLIQTLGFFGNELVTNGDFATDSDWTKETGWTISGGKLVATNVTGSNACYQTPTLVAGKSYKITFEITSYTSGGIKLAVGTSSTGSFFSSVGVHSEIVVAAGTLQARFMRDLSGANVSLSIDNASIVEVTGDQPRLNYDISNGVVQSCPSLLLEPASTNLVLDSNVGAYGNPPASELITTAPDGTNTAIIPIPNSTSDRYEHQITGGTYATDTKLTYSWYSKQISVPAVAYVGNLLPQVLTNITQVGSTIKVKDSINGWAKYSATFNITDGSLLSKIRLYFGNAVGVGNQSVAYWGHQLEVLTYCTSLIPTNGSIQTRAAETCFGAGNAATFNDSEGVLYAELKALSADGTNRYISLNDGTTSNRVNLFYDTNNVLRGFITGISSMATSATITDNNKVAIKYKSGDIALWLNGVEVATKTDAISLSGLSSLSFDQTGGLNWYGNVKDIRVYNEALTDAQLTTLTTL